MLYTAADNQIASLWLDNPHFHDLNPISTGWHRRGKGCSFGPGVRDVYIFQYIISGKGIFQSSGQTYSLGKHHLFLVRPDQLVFYQADSHDPWTYVWMDFDGTMVDELLQLSGFDDDTCVQYAPDLMDLFIFLQKNVDHCFSSGMQLCGKLYEVFYTLQAKKTPADIHATQPQQHVQRALDYIHTNYTRDISVAGIAQMIGVDRRYFSRIFTQFTGVSPQQYLVNYRLEKAALLLAQKQYSIEETANSVGYTDAFVFSKMYKNKYGVSPSKWTTDILTSKK